METVIDISNHAYAVNWLRSNVGETIHHYENFVQGNGWNINYSHLFIESNTPYLPTFIINIEDREKAVEFALLFG